MTDTSPYQMSRKLLFTYMQNPLHSSGIKDDFNESMPIKTLKKNPNLFRYLPNMVYTYFYMHKITDNLKFTSGTSICCVLSF